MTARGTSPSSRTDERRVASVDPRASVALLPVVSSRGVAAWVAGTAGNLFRGGVAATLAGRGTFGPSRSSAHGADCLIVTAVSQSRVDRPTAGGRTGQRVTAITMREPTAPSRLASPGERRSPELAAHSAANVRGRRVGGRFHRPPSNVAASPPRSASPFQSARTWPANRQKRTHWAVRI